MTPDHARAPSATLAVSLGACLAMPLMALETSAAPRPVASQAIDAGAQQESEALAEYLTSFDAMQNALRSLDQQHAACQLTSLAKTWQGRDVWLLTLSADPETAASRPALLIVAGLDARHAVGVETALRVARTILADHADLLRDTTFYIVPCANPDGYQLNRGKVNLGHVGNVRPADDDRDGAVDENGPSDVNGDGVITMMRRINPPLSDRATHMADPAEPRLLKRADPAKGERAIYALYVEGMDTDNDGQIGEDGIGGIDLDRNFLHRYPEHATDAGPMPLSEAETLALTDFVINGKNIIAAITYGRHDNLINIPDGRGTDVSGRGPRDLDAGDLDLYREVAKTYKELTGQQRAAGSDTTGSFQAWVYAQRGIPSFASTIWGRPDVKEQQPAASAPSPAPPSAPDVPAADPSSPPPPPPPPAARGGGARRGGGSASADAPSSGSAGAKPDDAEAAAWLHYSDIVRDKSGFIEWTAFDHPTLGKVEIGGFVPGFQMNPPAAELDDIGVKQAAFAVEVMSRRPRIDVHGPEIVKLADGLYEVRFGITNEGSLPTATAMARRARSIFPTVVRISTPVEDIVAGDRINRTWGIGGSGDRATYFWIVRAAPGSEIAVDIVHPHFGDQRHRATAE